MDPLVVLALNELKPERASDQGPIAIYSSSFDYRDLLYGDIVGMCLRYVKGQILIILIVRDPLTANAYHQRPFTMRQQ